jgi:hypothetical protein
MLAFSENGLPPGGVSGGVLVLSFGQPDARKGRFRRTRSRGREFLQGGAEVKGSGGIRDHVEICGIALSGCMPDYSKEEKMSQRVVICMIWDRYEYSMYTMYGIQLIG